MNHLAAWYQKKISFYDKKEWETMVERLLKRGTYRRRIVDFSSHARSYLIDVDLVRGSSFPKAKPTLGVRRVVWYAVIRLVFLPWLYRWWMQQTSQTCARFFFVLWLLQTINMILFFLAPSNLEIDINCILVPLGLMLALSVLHSQIVSTTEMEIAKVRPRYRRKTPHNLGHGQFVCDGVSGGGSAESGATSSHDRLATSKPAKLRRRHSRSHESATDSIIRKRKKDACKDKIGKNVETKMENKTIIKAKKAKDSDDEDYMSWRKRDFNTPEVTFTPPDDGPSNSSLNHKLLTRKRLETFLVSNQNVPRQIVGDGDDGFESLNGNFSNGSDGDVLNKLNKDKEVPNDTNETIKSPIKTDKEPIPGTSNDVNLENKIEDKVDLENSSEPVLNDTSEIKRVGVRFRNSWMQEMIENESSDEFIYNKHKNKEDMKDYQSSTSEGECSASAPSIALPSLPSHHTMSDWVGQTTNSEESSYESHSEAAASDVGYRCPESSWDPFSLLNPNSDSVKCSMWEGGCMVRAELCAADISWYVVARAERALAAGAGGAQYAGLAMAAVVALLTPTIFLVQVAAEQDTRTDEEIQHISLIAYLPLLIFNYSKGSLSALVYAAFGDNFWILTMNLISCLLRFALSGLVFFLLSVAERAYKQRFLYAKLFSHLTSARRARKSELPHFRLNTVRNIKTWLSTRSYLRRRGPQRSVDVIVSSAFVLTITLLACVSAQLLRESVTLECGWLLEALVWSICLGIYLLRLVTLGSNVNRKYRGCLSAILTEQINLHLAIEQRPQSKEQLTLANNVLKLAADLLKELDSPYKISGISANHYLYTITKVVILSALSGVLSEMLGFKLKLHKIKIK